MYNFILFILASIGVYHGVHKERPNTESTRQHENTSIERPKDKMPNTIRIITIGDSIT